MEHDGKVHNPLGGGSYVFKENFLKHVRQQIAKEDVRISIGAQPNSSPHFGTLVVFSLAFSLGKSLKQYDKKLKPSVFFEIIDTAPQKSEVINGVEYQVSLRESGKDSYNLPEYYEVLDALKAFSGIEYKCRKQKEFNSQKSVGKVLKNIIKNKDLIEPILDPDNGLLRIRVACPECGLTDKKGINNKISEECVESICPSHGKFTTSVTEQSNRFEYNTPLRNLIRGLAYLEDNKDKSISYEWLRVTGSDYAGFYQEQLLYKTVSLLGYKVHKLPNIIYAPLITDWSGAKLSKSLYVKENAYTYLPDYLICFNNLKLRFGSDGLRIIYNEVDSWLKEPYKLFRTYSVYYFMELFGYEK